MPTMHIDLVRYIAQRKWDALSDNDRSILQATATEGYSYSILRDKWTHWVVVPDDDPRAETVVPVP